VSPFLLARIMPAGEERRNSAWESLGRIAVFVLMQNVLYYLAHMAMHSNPAMYSIHKFHHRYNVHITPSSANAVSVAEFLFAYIIPPAIILLLVQPSKMENTIAMNIISHCSTLIHTPVIEEWCARNLPAWWVGTDDHFEHHRRLTKNYAAPCLHLDHLLGQPNAKEDVQKRN
jgi:sterol desaturase/sphingolipid hydroxylase (fatty acid hydroxylase superfamily)